MLEDCSVNLTGEQQTIVGAFARGESFAVQAFAGSGKTATIAALIADNYRRNTGKHIVYITLTKTMVEDMEHRMRSIYPDVKGNWEARTVHSLAYRGCLMNKRLKPVVEKMRTTGERISTRSLPMLWQPNIQEGQYSQTPEFLESMLSHFCQTERTLDYSLVTQWVYTHKHSEWVDGEHNIPLLFSAAKHVWNDIQNPDGVFTVQHDYYVKLWIDTYPQLRKLFPWKHEVVFIVDEAQDSTELMYTLLQRQVGTQIVCVGDSYQSIYNPSSFLDFVHSWGEYTGNKYFLSKSFRFGVFTVVTLQNILSVINSKYEDWNPLVGDYSKFTFTHTMNTQPNLDSPVYNSRTLLQIPQERVLPCYPPIIATTLPKLLRAESPDVVLQKTNMDILTSILNCALTGTPFDCAETTVDGIVCFLTGWLSFFTTSTPAKKKSIFSPFSTVKHFRECFWKSPYVAQWKYYYAPAAAVAERVYSECGADGVKHVCEQIRLNHKSGASKLVTIHSVKGLEYDHVLLPYSSVKDLAMPLKDARTRRRSAAMLTYVAITRAKKQVSISNSFFANLYKNNFGVDYFEEESTVQKYYAHMRKYQEYLSPITSRADLTEQEC